MHECDIQQSAWMTALEDWRAEADARIKNHRLNHHTLQINDKNGTPLKGMRVEARLVRHAFLYGTCVADSMITATSEDAARYRDWILTHCNAIVDENGMKWYTAEKEAGVANWEPGDAVAQFASENKLTLRGHCLFWDREHWVHDWVKNLPTQEEVLAAVDRRVRAAATHYQGQVMCWDGFNEMLDGGWYGQHDDDIYANTLKTAHRIDPTAALYCNEYGILGGGEKCDRYIAQLEKLQQQGAPIGGIGIQEHACERFTTACAHADIVAPTEIERMNHARLTPEAMWDDLDRLAELGLPIHLTEISAKFDDPSVRAVGLETLLRCAFAHPAVDCFMLWGFWSGCHWLGNQACLIDDDWNETAAGAALRNCWQEWQTTCDQESDADGSLSFLGYAGEYEVRIAGQTYHCRLDKELKQATLTVDLGR